MRGIEYTGDGTFSMCGQILKKGDRLMLKDARESGLPADALEVLAARDDFEPVGQASLDLPDPTPDPDDSEDY